MSLLSPIHHTFAPHVTFSYAMRTLGILLRPFVWQHCNAVEALQRTIEGQFHGKAQLFFSGREALIAILQSMNLQPGDEVIIQAYTCVAVPNAITAAGGTPVYADIDPDSLNLTGESVEQVLTRKTRAVICQHTFGIPAPTQELRELCDQKHLLLIEDCAHVIPDASGPAEIGKHGNVLFFSFGRDKALSGIAGGALLSRHPSIVPVATQRLSRSRIAPLLLYPLLYTIARPLVGIGIGKALLTIARALHLLIPVTSEIEKHGYMDSTLHSMPNAFALLALHEWEHLKKRNDHRRRLTTWYYEELEQSHIPFPSRIRRDLPLQKFPLFVKNADGIRVHLKTHNMHLHDGWTGCVICPEDVDLDPAHYVPGSDPEAETACQKILSLPTHPTMSLKQARRLMKHLNSLLKNAEY